MQQTLCYQGFLQVFVPRTVYSGQKFIRPVTKGTTPIQPQTPIVPINVSTINNAPTTIRIDLSVTPTFAFIVTMLIKGLDLSPSFTVFCSSGSQSS